MVSYSQSLTPPLTEAKVRQIIQEEIVKAFQALKREADHLDGYETAELDSRALENIKAAAEGTVKRLTCPHEKYTSWGDLWVQSPPTCDRCGEPEPEPVNPFEDGACDHTYDESEGEPTDCIECGSSYPKEK